MAYKDIVVFVDPSPAGMQRLRIAAGLTQRYAAHLIGVYVVPGDMDDRASDGFVRGERGVRAVLERHRAAEERAVVQVGTAIRGHRHARRNTGRIPIDLEHRERSRRRSEFALRGSGGRRSDDTQRTSAETGCPGTFCWPAACRCWSCRTALDVGMAGERVVIAWNASKEARRAIADALPLLSTARSVKIVVVDAARTPDRHGQEPGADIALHLARHGAPVEVEQLDVERGIGCRDDPWRRQPPPGGPDRHGRPWPQPLQAVAVRQRDPGHSGQYRRSGAAVALKPRSAAFLRKPSRLTSSEVEVV